MRSRAGSKPSLRPASWIGWKVMPRTQFHCSAKSMISPSSSSFWPAFTTTTSVVEMFSRSSASSACAPDARQVGAAQVLEHGGAQRVELQIDLEARLEAAASCFTKSGSCAMRMPLVLSMMWRIGRRFAAAMISRICGWIVGSPPEICSRSGSPSDATSASIMRSISASGRCAVLLRGGIGEADRAGEVAGLVDLDQRQAGMLLVVRAEAAVIGAAQLGARLHVERPVARLQVVMAELVVSGVGGDQRLLHAMRLAALEVVDPARPR